MESARREVLIVLLGRVFELGLISENTYREARNTLASAKELPELLGNPVCRTKEAADGSTQNTR